MTTRVKPTGFLSVFAALCTVFLSSACAAVSHSSGYDLARLPPADPTTVTERSVSSDRTGSGTDITIDELVTCASRRQDMAGPSNCLRVEKEVKGRFSPSAIRLCRHHVDQSGLLIFEDPGCALHVRTEEGASVQNVDVSGETAFFDRYITKAVKQIVEAQVAGLQEHQPEMLRHLELSLDHAHQARRAGNVPGLADGLAELREALRQGEQRRWQDCLDHVRHACIALSAAAGMNPDDTLPPQETVRR